MGAGPGKRKGKQSTAAITTRGSCVTHPHVCRTSSHPTQIFRFPFLSAWDWLSLSRVPSARTIARYCFSVYIGLLFVKQMMLTVLYRLVSLVYLTRKGDTHATAAYHRCDIDPAARSPSELFVRVSIKLSCATNVGHHLSQDRLERDHRQVHRRVWARHARNVRLCARARSIHHLRRRDRIHRRVLGDRGMPREFMVQGGTCMGLFQSYGADHDDYPIRTRSVWIARVMRTLT